jgi:hypothetical protein
MAMPETTAKPARQHVDLGVLIARLFATRAAQIAWFVLFALLTRVSTFGDPDYHNDELLYFLIGQRMHDGLLPYVDIWDRKGPMLFVINYLIAGVSRSVVAYQLAACLFAAATAFVVNRIAERFANRLGALLAGTLYLAMLPLYAGGGAQAPVIYNLFTALAALGVLSARAELAASRVPPRVCLAMASAGTAIACKQTALFEALFLGAAAIWPLRRAGLTATRLALAALRLALCGAAPMLAFAGFYLAIGHFHEFWHAMVTTNLLKPYNPDDDAALRLTSLAIVATPVLLPCLAAFAVGDRAMPRAWLAGWLLAALVGFVAAPNFIDHYMLPLVLPLSVAAAPALGWRAPGPIYGAFMLLFTLLVGPSLDFAARAQSRADMAEVVARIRREDPHPRLFVYQGPTYLYALLDSQPPTPLIFPVHLFHRPERNTSHLDTAGEVAKVLAWRPTVVITAPGPIGGQINRETAAMVQAYVGRCRLRFTHEIVDYYGPQPIEVHGGCR